MSDAQHIVWDVRWEEQQGILVTLLSFDRQLADGTTVGFEYDHTNPIDTVHGHHLALVADGALALLDAGALVSRVAWTIATRLLLFDEDRFVATSFGNDRALLRLAIADLYVQDAAHEWFMVGGVPAVHAADQLILTARTLHTQQRDNFLPYPVYATLIETYAALLYAKGLSVIYVTRSVRGLMQQQYATLSAVAGQYGLVLPPADMNRGSQ